MSITASKFFTFVTFGVLGFCCFLSMWFFFVMSFVRNKDINQYKIDNEMIISNLYRATQKFLYDIATNKPVSQTPSIISNDTYPAIYFENWGYADYLGKNVAIYPNEVYFYEGDYHTHGIITRITERAIYCLSTSNTLVIIRQSRKVLDESPKTGEGVSPRQFGDTKEVKGLSI